MIKKNNFFVYIAIFLGFTKYSIADNSILMHINFNVPNKQLLSAASLGHHYDMDCAGMTNSVYPNGYKITGYLQDDKGLEIGIMGPFPDDKRKTCQIYDSQTQNYNDVYFAIESMPIFFTYNGESHSCYINQNIGTSWDEGTRNNAKLQGQNSGIPIACNGLISTDTYVINHGSGSNNGNITINVSDTSTENDQTISMNVDFRVPNSSLLTSTSLSKNYTMACTGKNNGYNLSSTKQNGNIMSIFVTGPFKNDNRNSCQIKDKLTGNTNNVYFAVESLPIYFTYNGIQHSCFINQKVGTSFDRTTYIDYLGRSQYSYSKLQGENTVTLLPCNGSVGSDTYQVNAGHYQVLGLYLGNITINVAGY